jgi:SAM-dependent MidA family methyltransferase
VSALPLPDPVAAAHSARVVAYVRSAIEDAGGWIPFARYMDLVLYAPGLGYYTAGTTKLGEAGDFVTAPEMTPLFATALARQVEAILAVAPGREVVELGAGSGRLAAGLLNALAAREALPTRYAILDPSPDLRERQRAMLARVSPLYANRVVWLDRLPAAISGAVVANEVLDALPVHVAVRRNGVWLERGVAWDAVSGGFALAEAADTSSRAPAAERFRGTMRARSPARRRWSGILQARCVRALLARLRLPATEYYHPQSRRGTLMGHYSAADDPFTWPGFDITAHVDFTAMARAGERGGLVVAGFTAAAFPLVCGILRRLRRRPCGLGCLKAAALVQQLSPAEMASSSRCSRRESTSRPRPADRHRL